MREEIKNHLTEGIIPFWKGMRDDEFGGYYGWLDYDLNLDKKAEKGCILNSRITWFFANAYTLLKDESLLDEAKHGYAFLKDHCLDKEYGGIYWSLNYDGTPKDTTKHTYNQAFAIYALSTYFDATGDTEALELAKSLQQIIETHCTDEYGYLEAFTRDFQPESNEKLSENGVMAEKTMNTLLHVFEAYTELYRVTKDPFTGDRLRFMMDLFADKVYNKEKGRQEVFFDRTWNTLIDLYSYGHDIETSWLIDRGTEVLGDPAYREKLLPITGEIAENIYNTAYKNHSLLTEQFFTRLLFRPYLCIPGFFFLCIIPERRSVYFIFSCLLFLHRFQSCELSICAAQYKVIHHIHQQVFPASLTIDLWKFRTEAGGKCD